MKFKYLIVLALHIISFQKMKGQSSIGTYYNAFAWVHPGLEIEYQETLFSANKIWNSGKMRRFEFKIAPSAGMYHLWNNHSGIILGSDLVLETTSNGGYSFNLFSGGHLHNAFLANPTFETSTEGGFEEVRLPVRRQFQWRIGFGFGKDWLKTGKPYAIKVKLGITQPNLPGSLVIPNAWIGAHYYINRKS